MEQEPGAGGVAASWDDVLREHTDPPSTRSRQLVMGLWVLQLALCTGLVLGSKPFPALLFAVLAVINGVRWWRSDRRSSTAVSGDGLSVRTGDDHEHLPWDVVHEVRLRRPWAPWSTAKTADRWSVDLPGVSDAAAVRLEQFRAHLAAGRRDD